MVRYHYAAAVLVSTLYRVQTFPVGNFSTAADLRSVRRWEAGPELNGANFPDPSIIQVNGEWYSFATRTIGSSIHIQAAQSSDFITWSIAHDGDGSQRDALPFLPPWVHAASPNTWAPDISDLNDGSFVMYFSASTAEDPAKHCIGAAFASDVLGPYTPQNDPFICPLESGGAIDAAGYNDGGQRYVVYKIDSNSIGHGGRCGNDVPPYLSTPIMLLPVGADGVTIQGTEVMLLDNEGATDQGVVEAPSLAKVGDTYVLFFSSGCFTGEEYQVNYATADSLTGPYQRAATSLFQTGDYGLYAPGGASIDRDGRHMVFHARFGLGRALYETCIAINGDQVTT